MSEGVGDGDLEASSVTRGEPVCVPLHLIGVVVVYGSYGVDDMSTGMARVSTLSPVGFHAAYCAAVRQGNDRAKPMFRHHHLLLRALSHDPDPCTMACGVKKEVRDSRIKVVTLGNLRITGLASV